MKEEKLAEEVLRSLEEWKMGFPKGGKHESPIKKKPIKTRNRTLGGRAAEIWFKPMTNLRERELSKGRRKRREKIGKRDHRPGGTNRLKGDAGGSRDRTARGIDFSQEGKRLMFETGKETYVSCGKGDEGELEEEKEEKKGGCPEESTHDTQEFVLLF